MIESRRAVIVGAGIAGLAAALRLRQIGWVPVVVERAPARRRGGYLMHLSWGGYDAAGRLGVLPALRERHFDGFELVQVEADGRERFVVPSPAVQAMLGTRNLFLLRGDVEDVLYNAVAATVPVRFGTTVTAVRQTGDGVRIKLSDGSHETADLLIGADGRHSQVRRLVFGPEERFAAASDHIVAAFDVPGVPDGVRPGTVTQLPMIGRRMMLLTLDRSRSVMLLFRSPDPAADLADGPYAAVERAFGDLGWIVPDMLTRLRDAGTVYFDSQSLVEIGNWAQGSVALLGDAAWALPPAAGFGGSQAVEGAERLGTALQARPGDVPGALSTWQEELRPEVERRRRRSRTGQRRLVPAGRLALARSNIRPRIAASPIVTRLLSLRAAGHG